MVSFVVWDHEAQVRFLHPRPNIKMGSLKKFNDNCLNLSELQNKYKFEVLVETGCFKGDSIDFALKNLNLKHIFSCDIDEEYAKFCQEKYVLESKVFIYNKSSEDFLKSILPVLEDEACILFWLDAHFFRTFFPNYNDIDYPLETELEIIFEFRKNKKDVVLIDDFFMYENDNNRIRSPKKSLGSEFLKKYSYKRHLFHKDKKYLLLINNDN